MWTSFFSLGESMYLKDFNIENGRIDCMHACFFYTTDRCTYRVSSESDNDKLVLLLTVYG